MPKGADWWWRVAVYRCTQALSVLGFESGRRSLAPRRSPLPAAQWCRCLALQAVEQRDGGTDPAVIDWRASGVEQGMDLSHARVES